MRGLRLWVAWGGLLWMVACQTAGGGNLAGVANKPPIPAINASAVRGPSPLRVDFSSAGSRDPDGSITLFEWDFNYTGNPAQFHPQATGPATSNTYFQPGRYFAALRATDDTDQQAIDFLLIDVSEGNAQAPSADAFASLSQSGPWSDGPIGARVGQIVFFKGNGAPTTGRFVTFFWDFNETVNSQKQTSTSQNPLYVFQTPGNHFVILKVTDDQNLSTSDLITITVTSLQQNAPPNAYAEVSADGITYSKGPVSVPRNSLLYFRAPQLPADCLVPPMLNCDFEDKTNVQFTWDFGDGSKSTQQNTTHTFGVTGNRTVILTVTDTQNAPGTDRVTVNVYDPQAPSADAKASLDGITFGDFTAANPLSGASPVTVYFRGIGSDPRGLNLTYTWNFGDGSASGVQNPTHTFVRTPTQNRFTVSLSVTNTDRLSGSDPTPVVVVAGAPPVARIFGSPSSGDVRTDPNGQVIPLAVNFDATASYDPDNPNATVPPRGIASYKWDFCFDGNFGALNPAECPTQGFTCNSQPVSEIIDPSAGGSNTATPCFAYSLVGSHVAAVEVFDVDGLSSIGTTIITATGNRPPIARIVTIPAASGGMVSCAAAPCLIRFDGSTSTDLDGTIVSWEWNFVYDGSTFVVDASGTPTSFVYTARALYTAALRVTDDQGGQNVATVIVNVGNVVQVPPVVTSITPNEVLADLSSSTLVSVTFDSVSCDPDDVGNGPCPGGPSPAHPGITAFEWDFGDGTTGTGPTPTHPYDFNCIVNRCPNDPNFLAANFRVTLTVTDNENSTSQPFVQTVVISPFEPITQAFPVTAPDFTVRNEADNANFNLRNDGGVGVNVIAMQFCLLSLDGSTGGGMPGPCSLNDGDFNTVYAKKTGGNPLYTNFQQYFVSEDQFSGDQVAQWRQFHGFSVTYPILIDVPGAGGRLTALNTWIQPPLGTGIYNVTPPPTGTGLPVVTLVDFSGIVRYWGQANFGGNISFAIAVPGSNPPTTATWADLVEGFLKFFTPP